LTGVATTTVIYVRAGESPALREIKVPKPEENDEELLGAIKSEIFGKPSLYVEMLSFDETLYCVFAEMPTVNDKLNVFMNRFGWPIRGDAVLFRDKTKKLAGGGHTSVTIACTDKDIQSLPDIFAKDRAARAKRSQDARDSGIPIINVSAF
jgi:hypothetical protein